MEEQEKIDIREHLINWIDTFLKDGIIPKVVNPKAIKANYIPKQVIRDKINELKPINFNNADDRDYIIRILKELLEKGEWV